MAKNQAEPGTLQAKADATHGEVEAFGATIATLSNRQAVLAAERAKVLDCPSVQVQQDGAEYAKRCVDDILAGVRNFSNEQPQVQSLLQQLVAAIDYLRSPPQDPRQSTRSVSTARKCRTS